MKKSRRKPRPPAPRHVAEDEILPEYDFSRARRNPYAARLTRDAVVVLLDPDVAQIFRTAAAVNDALRALARIAERMPRRSRTRRSTA